MQRPDLEIYTKDFERVGIIDTFTSGQFERSLWEVGKMELHISLLASGADQLKIGRIVYMDADRAWEITGVKKSEGRTGLDLVVYGQELKGILRQRLVVPDEQDDNKHFGWDRVPTDKQDATPPPAPELESKTDSVVRLVAVAGLEYRVDNGEWQASPVFGSLDALTEYSFYARKRETWSHNPSEASPALTVTTDMGTQSVPPTPVMASRTGTSITLVAMTGCEYRRDSGSWQDSVVFSGLSPVTSYTFYARRKATATHHASPESAGASIMTTKADQTAPSAPSMASHTETSITLTAVSGCEYKRGSGGWQDSAVFTGLTLATAYVFYQRKKETATHEASPSSAGASLSTAKGSQTAPSAPTIASRTGTSIALTAISGCEYKRDSGAWQDSTAFTGLSPVTSYTFYARKKETATLDPSPASAGASITTDKGNQTAPAAPTVSDIEHDSAKVTSVAGAEVRLGAGSWFDSPKLFEGLEAETQYTATARMKETVTHFASPASAGKAFETPSAVPEEGSWAWVQWHVRNGTHLTEFAVGDVFTCLDSGSPINVMIIGMDVETPTNSNYTHSMTLHTVDCLPVTFQFDSPESGGHTDRQNYGNNRWMWSNVRQWLNSDASSYAWSSTHQYDKAPSSGFLSGYSGGGFLKLLDPELVAVLGSVEKKTALCDYDGVNGQDTTSEIAFLLSQYEVGLGTSDAGNVSGEIVYPWYTTNARRVKKVGASNSSWWLRSPYVSTTHYVRTVHASGALDYSRATNTSGLAPACVII